MGHCDVFVKIFFALRMRKHSNDETLPSPAGSLYSNSSRELFRKERDGTKCKPIAIFTLTPTQHYQTVGKRVDLALKETSVHYNTRHQLFI